MNDTKFNQMMESGEFEKMFAENKINELLSSGELSLKQIEKLVTLGKKMSKQEILKRQRELAKQPGYKEYVLGPLIKKIQAQQNKITNESKVPNVGNVAKIMSKKTTTDTKDIAKGLSKRSSAVTPNTAKKVGNVNAGFYADAVSSSKPKLRTGDTAANIGAKIYAVIKQDNDERKLRSELTKNREEEHFEKEKARHEELIKAIKKAKEKPVVPPKGKKGPPARDTKGRFVKQEPTKPGAPAPAAKPTEAPKPAPKPAEAPKPAPKPAEAPKPAPKPAEAPTAKPAAEVPAAPSVTKQLPTVPKGVGTAAKIGVGAAAAGALLMPSESVAAAIDKASVAVGVDKSLMYAMAKQESGFDPNAAAKTSSAKGLYQFISGTWDQMLKTYGSKYPILKKGPNDAEANAIAGALFIKENAAILTKAKIPVDATSIYAAHFLGAGGARTLFSSDKNADASAIMPKAAAANDFIFYDKVDGKPDKNKPRTVQQVIDVLFEKVGKYQQKYSEILSQPNNVGNKLNSDSVENKDLKGANKGTNVVVDNTKTTVVSPNASPPQTIKTATPSEKPTIIGG
jgi:hypothetical protein